MKKNTFYILFLDTAVHVSFWFSLHAWKERVMRGVLTLKHKGFIRTVCVRLYHICLTVDTSRQPRNCQHVLIQTLLDPDWSWEKTVTHS